MRLLLCIWLMTNLAVTAQAKDSIPHDSIQVDHIVNEFWARVEEGKVIVGDKVLAKKELEPIKVIFEQPLKPTFPTVVVPKEHLQSYLEERRKEKEAGGGYTPIIKVYAKILGTVLIPQLPDTKASHVTVTFSRDGSIISVQPSMTWAGSK